MDTDTKLKLLQLLRKAQTQVSIGNPETGETLIWLAIREIESIPTKPSFAARGVGVQTVSIMKAS